MFRENMNNLTLLIRLVRQERTNSHLPRSSLLLNILRHTYFISTHPTRRYKLKTIYTFSSQIVRLELCRCHSTTKIMRRINSPKQLINTIGIQSEGFCH